MIIEQIGKSVAGSIIE